MPTPVIMPKFEMAQETGTVSKWLKQEGETVAKDEPILEVETDKINMEVESPASGVLVGILAGPGTVVPIGQPIAYIIKPGETWSPPSAGEGAKAPAGSPAKSEMAQDSPVSPVKVGNGILASRTTPVAERIAEAHGLDLQAVPRQGERVTKADVETYLANQPGEPTSKVLETFEVSSDKIKAVPAARRLAHELAIDLKSLTGTGPGGRIQSIDVQQAVSKPVVGIAAPTSPAPAVAADSTGRPAIRRVIPMTSMRRTIAERLTASSRDIPQFTVSVDIDMSRALAVVEDWRAGAESGAPRVTLTTLLIKACAWTLARHPAVNVSFEQDSIIEWAEVNLGVAVAVEEGLIVPVIHGADRLGLADLAMRLAELSSRARAGQLRREDIQGGTFTISNLGMFGVDRFTAIINPPQAAILAVGRVTKQPVITEDDRIEVRPRASFTLTADHRVVDGALAGRFLSELQQVLEKPGRLL